MYRIKDIKEIITDILINHKRKEDMYGKQLVLVEVECLKYILRQLERIEGENNE